MRKAAQLRGRVREDGARSGAEAAAAGPWLRKASGAQACQLTRYAFRGLSTFLGRGSGFGEGSDGTFCPTWMVLQLPGFLLQKKETPEPVWCWARLPPSVSGLAQQSMGTQALANQAVRMHLLPRPPNSKLWVWGCGGQHKEVFSPEFPTQTAWLDSELHSFPRSLATVDGLFPQWLPIPAAQPSLEKLCQV